MDVGAAINQHEKDLSMDSDYINYKLSAK